MVHRVGAHGLALRIGSLVMPTALVLSAGGMFAAWEIGVCKVLCQHFTPDLIVGASAGAWNGWAIAGGATPEELACEWLDPSTATLMRTAPLHAKARELAERYRPRIPFGLTLVEVPRMRSQIVRGPDIGWRHLAATCSIPVVFPPVRIGGKLYVDGGVLGALPLWAAEEMGATRAIGLNCLTTWHFRALRRAIPQRRPGPGLEVIRIEPSRPLGSFRDTFHWSAAKIAGSIALGELDGKRALPSITM
jgi:predicted acylesterase/phospholipase RssA